MEKHKLDIIQTNADVSSVHQKVQENVNKSLAKTAKTTEESTEINKEYEFSINEIIRAIEIEEKRLKKGKV